MEYWRFPKTNLRQKNLCNMFLKKCYTISNIQYFYRIYPTSVTVPCRTEPSFFKNTSNFKSDVFPHRCIQRYIEKYPFTPIFTLNFNGKYTVTPTVTVIIVTARLIVTCYEHRYIFSDAWQGPLLLPSHSQLQIKMWQQK